jgi:hypothetical protein
LAGWLPGWLAGWLGGWYLRSQNWQEIETSGFLQLILLTAEVPPFFNQIFQAFLVSSITASDKF